MTNLSQRIQDSFTRHVVFIT